ncbi:MAG: hypothetical protein N3A60_10080, partial [Thermanaerothrix sp.]|nr:hypothetical protein [Thermanaerothrix sp.]
LPATSTQIAHGGETVIHTLILTNSGSATATVDLSVTPGAWGTTLQTPSPLSLAAGESADIHIAVTLPVDGTVTADSAVLTATVREQNDVNATVTLHSQRHHYAFELTTPDLSLDTPPGIYFPIPLTLHNTSTLPLPLTLHAISAHGWAITPLAPQVLAAGETRSLALFVSVPVGAAAGLVDTLTLEAQAQDMIVPTQHVEITLTVLPEPQLELAVLTPSPHLHRGDQATIEIGVINRGNLRDTPVMEAHVANPLSAVLEPKCADGALDPGTGTTCLLVLSVPAGTEKGEYTLEVCAASSYDPQVRYCRQAAVQVTDRPIFLPLVSR